MAAVVACVLAAPALAQAPTGQDVAERPTEYGIRFTPGIARAMARSYVQDALVSRYNLDPSKIDQATEAVARRFMEIAHRFDDGGYSGKFEQMVEGIMAGQLDSEGSAAIQPRSGKAIAEAIKPAMPAIRDLVRGVAQDVRPMLAPKEQLKFGTDLLGFGAAMNAFDEALDRWAQGDFRPGENPFESGGKPKLDDSGHSPAYNAAQRQAQQEVQKGEWEGWKQYVEDAKKLYVFDEGQAAGANSILNECLDHVAQYTQSDEWQRKVERNRLWMNLLGPLQVGASHPLRYCLQRGYGQLLDPIHAIGEELRQRIDAIPTAAQRRDADERIIQMLGEEGFVEKSAGQPGAPASQEVSPREPARSAPPAPTEVFDEKGSANDESGDIRRGP